MLNKIFKYFAIIVVVGFIVPSVSFAASGSLFDSVINAFQNKIFEFQQRMDRLRSSINLYSETESKEFTEYLYEGKQGEEVIRLQRLLSQYPDIYPDGVVTGYYGQLTKNAVMRFQKKHGISPIGVVGPETRAKLNQIVSSIKKGEVSTSTQSDGVIVTPKPRAQLDRPAVSTSGSRVSDYSHSLDPRPDYSEEDIEKAIHEKINDKREEFGLDRLGWSEDIYDTAKGHSEDQAEDSRSLVDSDKPCGFPILRHEGFEAGLTVGDRLQTRGVDYKRAAENLVLFSVSDNMIYRYNAAEGKPDECPDISKIDFDNLDSAQDKRDLLNKEINKRKEYLKNTPEVNWINKQWKDVDEIADQAVDMWMNSEGHRQNLLNEDFEKSAIGVSFAGDFLIVTHVLVQD